MTLLKPLIIIMILATTSGCMSTTKHINSSVVDYLYSDEKETNQPLKQTHLKLPLKVGIAFAPTNVSATRSPITKPEKIKLLEQIADNFRNHEFVDKLEVIPAAYLRTKGGFDNLEQISKMYDIDVIALVSYDQVQFTDEGALSMTYLTIVGAYIFSGEKNDTSTLLDTTIYDIDSRKLLFRAPGSSNVKGRSTPINLSEALREDSLKGFTLATQDMIKNLQTELTKFRNNLTSRDSTINVSD